MMSDIYERAYGHEPAASQLRAKDAEIERLHSRIKVLTILGESRLGQIAKRDAEIERLREWQGMAQKEIDGGIQEIARLRNSFWVEREKVGERDSEIKRLRQVIATVKEAVDDE
jgi:peptidoglycan hydrolase CwlO-like protein